MINTVAPCSIRAMKAKQALAWVKKRGITVESAQTGVQVWPASSQAKPSAAVGGDIRRVRKYSPFRAPFAVARCLGVPPGGWQDHLCPSAVVAGAGPIGPAISQSKAWCRYGSAYRFWKHEVQVSRFQTGCQARAGSRESTHRAAALSQLSIGAAFYLRRR